MSMQLNAKNKRWVLTAVMALALVLAAAPIGAVQAKFTGTINDDMQLVTEDGTVYELADDENALISIDHIGKQVEIVGIEELEGDMKVIRVAEVNVLE
jgi:hypothetical protein